MLLYKHKGCKYSLKSFLISSEGYRLLQNLLVYMLPRLEKINSLCFIMMQSVLENYILGLYLTSLNYRNSIEHPIPPLTSVCFLNAQCAFHSLLLLQGNSFSTTLPGSATNYLHSPKSNGHFGLYFY